MFRNRTLLTLATTVGAVILIIAVGGGPNAMGMPGPAQIPVAYKGRVLLIVREHSGNMSMMIEKEVKPMIAVLTSAGYSVTVASRSGSSIAAGSEQLNVDKKLSAIKVGDYVGIIVPCMAAAGLADSIPEEAVDIIRDANNKGIPIAAQQSGVLILGSAGVLEDKDFAIADGYQDQIQGGLYSGIGVVRDGNIVTSGTCPRIAANYHGYQDGTERLVSQFIRMLPDLRRLNATKSRSP